MLEVHLWLQKEILAFAWKQHFTARPVHILTPVGSAV
jgi:hypothetical protein